MGSSRGKRKRRKKLVDMVWLVAGFARRKTGKAILPMLFFQIVDSPMECVHDGDEALEIAFGQAGPEGFSKFFRKCPDGCEIVTVPFSVNESWDVLVSRTYDALQEAGFSQSDINLVCTEIVGLVKKLVVYEHAVKMWVSPGITIPNSLQ